MRLNLTLFHFCKDKKKKVLIYIWCATRQVDNEKNIKFLCCPVCAGQYFIRPITVHEIQTVLIHQGTFAGGHLCDSLYMPLSLVHKLLSGMTLLPIIHFAF